MSFVVDFQNSIPYPSPNFSDRRLGLNIQYIVIHYTEMKSGSASLQRLCDPAYEVSCHYLIDEDGSVFQLVAENKRAWHAGKSFWKGQTDLNSLSIGIELQNRGHPAHLPPYPDVQINSLIVLLKDLTQRYSLNSSHILGHSDIAFERKQDPGEHFPWAFVMNKLGFSWLNSSKKQFNRYFFPSAKRLSFLLFQHGYDIRPTCKWTKRLYKAVLSAQRRYTPDKILPVYPPCYHLVFALKANSKP